MTDADAPAASLPPRPTIKRLGWANWGLFAGEWNPGDVQKRIKARPEYILSFPYAYSSITQIGADISKMRLRLMQKVRGVVSEAEAGGPVAQAILRVLRKPNRVQTIKAFVESWTFCLLIYGEAFILIERDAAGRLTALHVMDPWRVQTRLTADGRVFYDLSSDNVAGIPGRVNVPDTEIIHHVFNALYHPLCGVSPLDPMALSVMHGIALQQSQTDFFSNGAQPGGILTAEGDIKEDERERLQSAWDEAFTGKNAGRVAILGGGLRFEKLMMTARDAQVEAQFNVTAEMVCSALHFPLWKVKGAAPPQGHSPAELNQIYYSDCLQTIAEGIEGHLDVGLGAPDGYYFEFRVGDLLRMDEKAQMEKLVAGVGGKTLSINDARRELGLPPVPGGDQPWMQMQDMPIELLLDMQRQLAAGGAKPASSDNQRAADVALKWLQ